MRGGSATARHRERVLRHHRLARTGVSGDEDGLAALLRARRRAAAARERRRRRLPAARGGRGRPRARHAAAVAWNASSGKGNALAGREGCGCAASEASYDATAAASHPSGYTTDRLHVLRADAAGAGAAVAGGRGSASTGGGSGGSASGSGSAPRAALAAASAAGSAAGRFALPAAGSMRAGSSDSCRSTGHAGPVVTDAALRVASLRPCADETTHCPSYCLDCSD